MEKAEKRRRNLVIGTIIALMALVIGAIVVSSIQREHLHLDNGSVWVTSLKDGKAARFNPTIADADASVSASAATFDVAQNGNSTVMDDNTHAYNVDAATIDVGKRSVISATTSVMMGGSTVAFYDSASGKLWLTTAARVGDLATNTPATLTLPRGSKVTVDSQGKTYAYRSSDGMVLTLADASSTQPKQVESLTGGKAEAAQGFAVVGDVPVALIGTSVSWPGKNVTLSAQEDLTLQATPSDGTQSGFVAIASRDSLTTVDLTTKAVASSASTDSGIPAVPVSLGGCVSSAWAAQRNNYLRVCTAAQVQAAHSSTLGNVTPTSQLVFRTNHRAVVLNDVTNGNVWNPNDSTNVIKIEWNKLDTRAEKNTNKNQKSVSNHEDFTKQCSNKDNEIKAIDDSFGAHSGEQQILDVLRNDQQSSCSVLRIEKIEPLSKSDGTVASIYDGRYLQLSLTSASHGTLVFTYSISDGRGQTSSATVHLTVEESRVNQAPAQTDTPPDTAVEQGAHVSVNALDSFADPDGDPLSLVAASAQNSSKVALTTRADGRVTFDPGSVSTGRISVAITVSDGAKTAKGVIYFSVKAANSLSPVIDPIVRKVQAGTSAQVQLKDYVHSNSASPLVLGEVKQEESESAPATGTARAEADDLSVTFTSSSTGSHYVTYAVSQGEHTALGMIRFDVTNLSSAEKTPIAANDIALLDSANSAIVDPLSNDVDPLDGVLAVTSVSSPSESGIKTGVVSHKRVYITAQSVPSAPVKISYTVSNGTASATGRITLQPPNPSTSTSAPAAKNINATVRQNGIVTVPVMDHVTAADGTDVSLTTSLHYDKPTFKGLVFVSGDNLRYQAGSQTGTFPVIYTVKDNLGNTASATVTISVHKKDAATKQKPTPADVQAQVVAGQIVKIPITLLGIDPDGDDVSLLGLGNDAPQKGRIDSVGADYLLYEAYPDSSGTDTFHYAVEDWSGQRVTAKVRVGILTSSTDSGVFARDDTIAMRPNRKVDVPVTINDISEDNEELKVATSLETQGIEGAAVRANNIDFTTPSESGEYYIVYTVCNKAGICDTATLSVKVSADAPISAPTALDDLVPAAQTIDKRSVDVDVSDFISNPSGTTDELSVNVDASARDHAHVASKRSTVISVELTNQARAVPYTVTNTRYHLTSTAFIQVPAYGVFPPTLRPNAPALRVNAGDELTIKLDDYVRVGAGKSPTLRSKNQVSATHAATADVYKDAHTLTFTAPKNYSGPASVTFTVSDAVSGANVSSSTLSLPITVVGSNAAPPRFTSTTLTVVAGEGPQTVSAPALTTAPSGFESAKSTYQYSLSGGAKGFSASMNSKGILTAAAASTTTPGTTATLSVSVRYDTNKFVKGAIILKAAATTRPLPRIGDVQVKASAGASRTINVLSGAYNPFPKTPLALSGARSSSSNLSVKWTKDGTLTLTPAKDTGAMSATVTITVTDATKSPDRQVSAQVRVSVTDRPAAPRLSPVASTPQNGRVSLAWSPGSANGSPITDYEVTWNSGSKSCGQATQCTIDGLANATQYSFKVRARNAEGWSDYSNSITATADTPAESPHVELSNIGTGRVRVSWQAPTNSGSAITSYRVQATCSDGGSASATVGGASRSATLSGLPHSPCSVWVLAKNNAGWSSAVNSSTITALGTPGAPTISIESTSDGHIKGKVSVDARGQSFSHWNCTLDSATCSVSGSENTSFDISVPNAKWYVGATVSLRISASFAGETSPVTQQLVTMKKFDIGTIELTSVERNSSARSVAYSYSFRGNRPGADVPLTTRLSIDGCAVATQKFAPDTTLSATMSTLCTGSTATISILINNVTMTTSAGVPVKDTVSPIGTLSLPTHSSVQINATKESV
jgi:hypothetical protein